MFVCDKVEGEHFSEDHIYQMALLRVNCSVKVVLSQSVVDRLLDVWSFQTQ